MLVNISHVSRSYLGVNRFTQGFRWLVRPKEQISKLPSLVLFSSVETAVNSAESQPAVVAFSCVTTKLVQNIASSCLRNLSGRPPLFINKGH